MNLLTEIDWRAEDQRARLHGGYLPATEVLRILQQQELLPSVRGYDLAGDDLRVAEEIDRSVLWVGPALPPENYEYLEDAPPIEQLPPTWREEHPLDDRRCLTLPGERLHDRTLSFWQESPDLEERPSVLSLTIDRDGFLSGLAWWRRKKCVPTPPADGKCKGGDDECVCEIRRGLSGRRVIGICKCKRQT
jgi:hypothetical protein